MLYALQSAIMMMAVTRLCGVEDGGIFSIAYTTAQLMYAVGCYSSRTFQATDTGHVYSYADYSHARVVTCVGMAAASLIYCILRQYDVAKAGAVLVACAYKLIEVVEDLDHGELQREGRLDIAGRVGTFRVLLNDAIFFAVLLITRNMMAALAGSALVALIVTVWAHMHYKILFCKVAQACKGMTGRLLLECFPLFVAGFLTIYITNASKYAIDVYWGDEVQAYFSVIFTPVFTINLLSGVIFQPQMRHMAVLWNSGELSEFRRLAFRQVFVIGILSISITAFGILIGLRLLGLIYGLILDPFVTEFAVLLMGGGFVALHHYMSACITVMRRQKFMLVLSVVTAITALFVSSALVSSNGLTGACWSYFLLMLIEAAMDVGLAVTFYFQAAKDGKSEEKNENSGHNPRL